MSGDALLERLRAWEQGSALPSCETLPFARATTEDRLVLAFVRMGGEASPWGIALGSPGAEPQCFTVAEPRNRDAHARFVAEWAPTLLAHVGHPEHLPLEQRPAEGAEAAFPRALLRGRQLWVPGPTHLEMLHLLDFRYTLAVSGEDALLRRVRALGRACGWLFREATRPGQLRVHDATARLRQVFAFPAEPRRQLHLGYLLAWLGSGDRAAHEGRALEAELESVGTSLMPDFESKVLVPLVDRFHQAPEAAREEAARAVHEALVPELRRRFALTVAALQVLDADPRVDNPQLGPVLDLGAEECHYQYFRHEARALREDLSPEQRRSLGSHPETDFSPARAASRYFQHLHAFEVASGELVHGDKILLERALDAGNGFSGVVLEVGREQGARSGPVRWTVEAPADDSLRLREESKVCLVGARAREAVLLSVETVEGRRKLVLEFKVNRPRVATPGIPASADDAAWVGREVTFLEVAVVGLSLRKSIAVHDAEGPGAWLTHAAPLPEPSPAVQISPDLVSLVRKLQ